MNPAINPAVKTLISQRIKLKSKETKLLDDLKPVQTQLAAIERALEAMGHTEAAQTAAPVEDRQNSASTDIVQPAFTGVKS